MLTSSWFQTNISRIGSFPQGWNDHLAKCWGAIKISYLWGFLSPKSGLLMRMMRADKSPWSDQPLERTSGTQGTHTLFSKHVWIPLDDLCMKLFIWFFICIRNQSAHVSVAVASPAISTVPMSWGTGRNICSGGSSAGPMRRKRSRNTRSPGAKSASATNNSFHHSCQTALPNWEFRPHCEDQHDF